ncbi:acyltransferase [Phormidium sp. FACHB-322]|nr:acyltransferase [Phormidium sp. FACHB-77]MBD2030086.1 acyltransferase [Phormidium sp. FACHB-322]MBD2051543.1 acyltransferase [Leptolyngbya sp. FACHB-60]
MQSYRLDHDWFSAPLPDNVVLGDRNWIYSSFAFRHYYSQQSVGLQTGHDTGIYNGTFFNLGPNGRVEIGNYCTLVGVIICTDCSVVIRDYTFIAHDVVLADSTVAFPFVDSSENWESNSSSKEMGSPIGILIEENAWIGAKAILLKGTHIGAGSIVGACSVVSSVVPPYTIVVGNPARVVRHLDKHTNYYG